MTSLIKCAAIGAGLCLAAVAIGAGGTTAFFYGLAAVAETYGSVGGLIYLISVIAAVGAIGGAVAWWRGKP
jgi:hypothetical protein